MTVTRHYAPETPVTKPTVSKSSLETWFDTEVLEPMEFYVEEVEEPARAVNLGESQLLRAIAYSRPRSSSHRRALATPPFSATSRSLTFRALVLSQSQVSLVRPRRRSAICSSSAISSSVASRPRLAKRAEVAPTARPGELASAVGGLLPLPPAGQVFGAVGVDGVGEELHRSAAAVAAAVLAGGAGDFVGHLGEVVGQVALAELGLAQVPAVLVGGVEALALQGAAPAAEHAGADVGGDELGGDVVGETQQTWTWTCQPLAPSVTSTTRAHPSSPPNSCGVLDPGRAGGDGGPGVAEDVPAALAWP